MAQLPCDARTKYFICNRPKSVYKSENYIGIDTHSEDITYTFNDANEYCKLNYNTSLASYTINRENEIINIINNISSDNTWIGLTGINIENNFIWIDGNSDDIISINDELDERWNK